MYNRIYIFIEGDTDRRFFENIIEPILKNTYNYIGYYEYSQKSSDEIKKFINAINNMESDYIFTHDADQKAISVNIQNIINKLNNIEREKIIIVVEEIESWYFAGLSRESCEELGISYCSESSGRTDDLNKGKFEDLIPKRFDSKIDFMMEVIKYFSIETAIRKNTSFKYFNDKYDILDLKLSIDEIKDTQREVASIKY